MILSFSKDIASCKVKYRVTNLQETTLLSRMQHTEYQHKLMHFY